MVGPRQLPLHLTKRYVAAAAAGIRSISSAPSSQYGRTAIYRRVSQNLSLALPYSSLNPSTPVQLAALSLIGTKTFSRHLHASPFLTQQPQPKDDIKDPPRPESSETKAEESQKAEQPAEEKKSETEGKAEGEGEGEKKKEDKKDLPPPPPHGDKTPWQVFTETLRTEFKASKEWNESTKQLAGEVQDFRESEGVRRARAAYDATAGRATTKTAEAIKGTAKAVGQGAAWTWDSTVVQGIRKGVNATGRGIEKATRPVRETETFKSMSEAIDSGASSRYGGWVEKEERKKRRAARDLKEGIAPVEKMEEDPNAGTNITLHKDSAWREAWNSFRENSKVMQSLSSMRNTYEESENPLITTARSITDRISGFFAENETAMVIKKFREIDPSFQLEPFLREMREYILPEVLDAYVKGDVEVLKMWLSAAQFQVYSALMEQYTKAGLKSDGRILDIRHVDILNARLLEPGEIPVFIITCRTQEVHVYKNKKTNQLAAGMEDRVQLVTYAIGVTRLPDEVNNPETRGWRMIELQKAGRDYI